MKRPADLRTYVEGYLHALHNAQSRFPGETEVRYIADGYIWEGQTRHLVQYILITKTDTGEPFHAKCSCEISFDVPAT
jgi:hypothetical protein